MKREWEPDIRGRDIPTVDALHVLGAGFPGFDARAVEAFIALGIVSAELQARVESILQDHGLSRPRFILLLLLRKAGTPLTPAELAARTNTSTASMATLLEGLVTAGLLRREARQDDRRSYWIHVTPEGNAKLDAVLPGVYERMRDAMRPLDDGALAELVGLLVRLRAPPADPR